METLLFQESPIIVVVLLSIWFILMLLRSRWQLLILIIFVLFILFYRNYPVYPQKIDNVVMSPADGKVSHIEYTKGYVRIGIFLNLHNVHIQKVPIDGQVMSIDYYEGAFHPAGLISKSEYNEKSKIVLNTKYGPIVIYQIAGVLVRTIVTWINIGDIVESGQDLGMIKFGSRVDIEIPLKHISTVCVSVGQIVDFNSHIAKLC
jgi:phosphatidylserine decarboxylase